MVPLLHKATNESQVCEVTVFQTKAAGPVKGLNRAMVRSFDVYIPELTKKLKRVPKIHTMLLMSK